MDFRPQCSRCKANGSPGSADVLVTAIDRESWRSNHPRGRPHPYRAWLCNEHSAMASEELEDVKVVAEADEVEGDRICKLIGSFDSFKDLLNAKGGYRPTIHVSAGPHYARLADLYDDWQADRGDPRRAFRRE